MQRTRLLLLQYTSINRYTTIMHNLPEVPETGTINDISLKGTRKENQSRSRKTQYNNIIGVCVQLKNQYSVVPFKHLVVCINMTSQGELPTCFTGHLLRVKIITIQSMHYIVCLKYISILYSITAITSEFPTIRRLVVTLSDTY